MAHRCGAGQRLNDRAGADLVVVAADDIFFGGDVGVGQESKQSGGESARRRAACRRSRPPADGSRQRGSCVAGRRAGSPQRCRLQPGRRSARPAVRSPLKRPIGVASTFQSRQSVCRAGQLAGGTASTMRSCASLSQISQGCKPGYLSGTCDSSTSTPSVLPSSPTALDSPPAPQSVMAE